MPTLVLLLTPVAGCLTSTAALLISCFLRERVQLVDSQQAASKQAGSAAELAEEGAADKASKTPLLLEVLGRLAPPAAAACCFALGCCSERDSAVMRQCGS